MYFCFALSLAITLFFSLKIIDSFASDTLTKKVFDYLCNNIAKENYLIEYKKWFVKSLQEDSFNPFINIDYLEELWLFVIKLNLQQENGKNIDFSEFNRIFSQIVNSLLTYASDSNIHKKTILLLTTIIIECSKKEEFLQDYSFSTLFNSENIDRLASIYVYEGCNKEINELRTSIKALNIKRPLFEMDISDAIIKKIAYYSNKERRSIREIFLSFKTLNQEIKSNLEDEMILVLDLADYGAIRSIACTLLEGNEYSQNSYPFMMICPFVIYLSILHCIL